MEARERVLRTAEVLKILGVARTTLWRWERDGLFPRRRQLGPGVVGFLASEVDEWIQGRPVVGRPPQAA